LTSSDSGTILPLQAHRHGKFGVAVVQVGGVCARDGGVHRLGNGLHRNAQGFGALTVDTQKQARCGFFQGGVYAHDVRRFAKGLGHALGQFGPAGGVGAVNFSNDG
jgi:hypothetical protein